MTIKRLSALAAAALTGSYLVFAALVDSTRWLVVGSALWIAGLTCAAVALSLIVLRRLGRRLERIHRESQSETNRRLKEVATALADVQQATSSLLERSQDEPADRSAETEHLDAGLERLRTETELIAYQLQELAFEMRSRRDDGAPPK